MRVTAHTGYVIPKAPLFGRVVSSTPMSVAIYIMVVGTIVYSAYDGSKAMGYNWQWYRIPSYLYTLTDNGFQWGEIAIGLVKTLELSLLAFVLALLLGLLVAILRLSGLLAP